VSRWRVGRTHEEQPDYQYRVFRRLPDGSAEVYGYADTRQEADELARAANEGATGEKSR
jgi:hypothetical protein